MEKGVRWFALLVTLTAAALICYGPYLNNYFACDDFKYLENIISGGPKAITLGYNAQMRLVSNWAWVPLYWVSGTNPVAYNTFSLCLSVANAFLLYYFLTKLLKNEFVAALSSVLFVMNAAAADAIFWKANFSGLLSLFFSLLSLSAYLEYKEQQSPRLYWGSIGLFLLAIFSKEDAAAVILLLIVVETIFLDGFPKMRFILLRTIPYLLAVAFYLAVTTLTYRYYHVTSETWGWFKLRPVYSLLGGFSAFFIHPDGVLDMTDARIYLTALFIALSFVFLKDRKPLLLGYLWIVLAFAPSSLTSIGVFDPRSFTSSTSRFYYAPSVGVAVVLAACLDQVKSWAGRRTGYVVALLFVASYLAINAPRIHQRGDTWFRSADHARNFMVSLKRLAPAVPSNSFLLLDTPHKPVGWMWQAANVTYGCSGIQGGRMLPESLGADQSVFLVKCDPATVLPYQVERVR